MAPKTPPLPARAKHVIYLHMAGSPPQQELFDYKPKLVEMNMQSCPDELLQVLQKERLPFIKLEQRRPKMLGTPYRFAPQGKCGTLVSELLPQTAMVSRELCVIHSTFTEAINHDPAITYIQTGSQIPG